MVKRLLSIIVGLTVLVSCAGAPMNRYRDRLEDSGIYQKMNDQSIIHMGGTFIYDTQISFIYATTKDPSIKHYTVYINTDGGDAYSCTAIINHVAKLQKQGIKFTMITDTKASSAGFFLWMMGDVRLMTPGSILMIHTMRGQFDADEKVLPERYVKMFDTLDENIVLQTMKRFPNVDPMTLETMLRYSGMTWIDSQEAIELGMSDGMAE